MTWGEVERKLRKAGCKFVGQDKKHAVYYSPMTGKESQIPRHSSKEAATGTVEKVFKRMGVK